MTHDSDKPLVTFALFAYNQEKYIREAVEAALSQTYEPLEIILSDDGSSDETFEIMRSLARDYVGPHQVVVRKNPENSGLAAHINEVLRMARGEVITWAAGDDVASANRTEILVTPLLQDEGLVATHSSLTEINLDGEIVGARNHSDAIRHLSFHDVCKSGRSIVTQSLAFRRKVFHHYGPFRRDLTNEGPVMAFRATALGRVWYIARPLTKYRVGSGVSTYSGGDVEKSKVDEPKKISNWRRTSFMQMRDDLSRLAPDVVRPVIKMVNRNIRFHSNLLEINEGRRILHGIFSNFLIAPLDTQSIRAAIRTVLPVACYGAVLRSRWESEGRDGDEFR